MSKESNEENHLNKIMTKEEFYKYLARLEETIDQQIKNDTFNYSISASTNLLHTGFNPKLINFYQPTQQPPNETLENDTPFPTDLAGDNDHK